MDNNKNPLNVTVSYCKNNEDKNPTEVNLYDFLTDGRFKKQVTALRNATPEKQKKLKDALPACIVGGLFDGRKSLVSASSLICIDIDEKDNTEVEGFDSLKERIKECPYVLFCAHSARGKGYFCIIQIADHKKFLAHFLSLERDFLRAGIVIDKSCKNISWLRYAFYDPQPYINLDAEVYYHVVERNKKATRNKVGRESVSDDVISNAYRIGMLTASLDKQGKDITESYPDWFYLACAIANEFGEEGRPMFHDLSKNYANYDPDRTNTEYDKVLRYEYNVPIGKIFKEYAAENGVSLAEPLF